MTNHTIPKYPMSNPKDTDYYIRKTLHFMGLLVSAMAFTAVVVLIFVFA